MIKIRLTKTGAKNQRIFRIVAIEDFRKRNGKALDIIGYWNAKKDEKKINLEKIKFWTERGAVLSRTVSKLIEKK